MRTKEQLREYARKWYALNREKEAKRNLEWRSKNREWWASYMRGYNEKHRDHLAHWRKMRKIVCPPTEKQKEHFRVWNAAWQAKRKALELMAMPPWVNREQITRFYSEAHRLTVVTGISHEVDHIWPLMGKGFVGLHVPWNLRVITRSENRMKKNKVPILQGGSTW